MEPSLLDRQHADTVCAIRDDESLRNPSSPALGRFPAGAALAGVPSLDTNGLRADELRFQFWLAVFHQHRHDFAQILLELIQGGALRMRTCESRYIADEEVCFRVPFNDGHEGAHVSRVRFCGTTVNPADSELTRLRPAVAGLLRKSSPAAAGRLSRRRGRRISDLAI